MTKDDAGAEFHRLTAIGRRRGVGIRFGGGAGRQGGERVGLLPPPSRVEVALDDAIAQRRSCRELFHRPLLAAELSNLLHAAHGITGRRTRYLQYAAPSAGGLYPFDIYLFVNHVEGFPPGLYQYVVNKHGLCLLHGGDFKKRLYNAGLDQELFLQAGAVVVFSAEFARVCDKYGQRGYRYAYIEAGHMSQNIALVAAALGLGSVPVGAFYDRQLNDLIGLDGVKRAALYLHALGSLQNSGAGSK